MRNLKKMKKIEMIIEGEFLAHLTRLLEKIEINNYTIFRNLEGRGKAGYHEGQLLFNDEDALVMIMTVVDEAKAQTITEGLALFFEKHSGVMFISDTLML
ncbi:MAG: P-II family nitrogen regulator [Sulfurimonas sp.]|jgi:nitrogen regulatory protein PII|nr:P-II family nitrogen regulator [Sulfurimonas sp.]